MRLGEKPSHKGFKVEDSFFSDNYKAKKSLSELEESKDPEAVVDDAEEVKAD